MYRLKPVPFKMSDKLEMHTMEDSMRPANWLFSFFVVAGLCAAAAAAQTSGPESQTPAGAQASPPLVQANGQAVAVDVVVMRGNGEPALRLRQQDFEVLEDGKPQAVDLFEEHTAARGAAIARVELPANVYTNLPVAPTSDAVNVLLLDSLNTPEADQAYVRKQLAEYLKKMQPDTRVAIFTLNTRLRLLQGFTSDVSLLQAALASKAAAPGKTPASRTRDDDLRDKEDLSIIGAMANTGGADSAVAVQAMSRSLAEQAGTQAGQRASLTLAALQGLARSLAAIPGRKNLIWFATSFPVTIFPNGPNRQTLANGREIGDAVRQTAAPLTESRVALYPVSAQGIVLDTTTNADSGGQPQGDDFERAPLQQSAANTANTAAMDQLAADTGGQAFYTGNDLSRAVERATENGAHYYTLVYTPANTKLDGRFRSIEVRVSAGKYRLAYRRGYFADNAGAAQAKPVADPLPALLARGMPNSTQIVYQVRVLPEAAQPAQGAARAGGNSKLTGPVTRYKVDFAIQSSGIELTPAADGTHTGKIELELVAYNQNGNAANWTGGAMNLSLNAASYAKIVKDGMPAHLEIDLPGGDLSLAIGVYDWGSHRAGTLEIPVHTAIAHD